jgi:transposase InsO family protein
MNVLLDYRPSTAGPVKLEVIAYRGAVASDPATIDVTVRANQSQVTATIIPITNVPPIDPNDRTCRALVNVGLNVRVGPGTQYNRITTVQPGTQIPINGRTGDNSWLSDITYIRTIKGFCYLALITDMYSRKIVGYDISDSLELVGCLRALKKALASAQPAGGLVHHSDRGIQYCSNQYVAALSKRNIKISMTEENHCYENAIAERVNGILKDEFYLDQCFVNTTNACVATKNAIDIYNKKRLHVSLGYKTPNMVFKNTA